jgi:hypothetical protein
VAADPESLRDFAERYNRRVVQRGSGVRRGVPRAACSVGRSGSPRRFAQVLVHDGDEPHVPRPMHRRLEGSPGAARHRASRPPVARPTRTGRSRRSAWTSTHAGPFVALRASTNEVRRRRTSVTASAAFAAVASRFEDERHRAVVDQLDGHARTEGTRLDPDAEVAERFGEALVQRLGDLRARGVRERGAVALRGVGDQRELADDEGGAADVEERPVEPLALVLEDAQARDLAREAVGLGLRVALGDAEQDEQARADLAARVERARETRWTTALIASLSTRRRFSRRREPRARARRGTGQLRSLIRDE